MSEAEREYHWDIANDTMMGRYLTKIEREFIEETVREYQPKECLDIGGGSGRFAVPLFETGLGVTVMEYDIVPIKKLIRKTRSIPVIQADAHFLPFQDKKFDCVMSIETLSYFRDTYAFISESSRVLREGGLLVVTTENSKSYKCILRKIIGSKDVAFYKYSTHKIKEMLTNSDFEIKKCFGFNWLPLGRSSNSRFVTLFSFIEKILNFKYLPDVSPWIFIIAEKKQNENTH